MTFALYSSIVFVASLLVAIRLKERALYVLFVLAFTQNFVLAYLYTNGLANKDLCRSLILFKEFLLFQLFVYAAVLLSRRLNGQWPRPLLILFGFTAYCTIRFSLGAVLFGDFTADGLRKLRMMCFPIQIVTVALAISWLYPEFSRRFIRQMTYVLAILAVIGIILFAYPSGDFWKQHADIASYNMEVKGEDPSAQIEEQGIPGTAAGREAFLFLSSFRAMGTFADPLAFGFCMAMPVLLLMFYYPKEWSNYLLLALCGLALFLTFSRSSWIFSAIAVLYMLIRKRRYSPVIGMAALVLVALVIWPALQEFAASGYSYLSWTNPEGEHAQGLVWFYQRAFLDLGNVLGKGMDDSVQAIPESGYAFLLEHFGFVAYASFLWFCFSLLSYLKQGEGKTSPLALLAQAVAVCIVIVMHTSQYPFAFTEYLFIWFVVGSSICLASKIQPSDESQELAI